MGSILLPDGLGNRKLIYDKIQSWLKHAGTQMDVTASYSVMGGVRCTDESGGHRVNAIGAAIRQLHYRTEWTQGWQDPPWASGVHRWIGCSQCGADQSHAQWPCPTIVMLNALDSAENSKVA